MLILVPRPGLIFMLCALALNARGEALWRFHFGSTSGPAGSVPVGAADIYRDDRGYGLEAGQSAPGAAPAFFLSARVPEGNYAVAVTLGDPVRPAVTTVKAELRRLAAGPVRTAPGEFRTVRFVVNVRQPLIPGGGAVRLKPREKTGEAWDWDDRLTLEFDGEDAAVRTVEIEPAAGLPTVYLAGDSTVCDQPYEPFASWGQMITAFFGPGVAIANHAESGESLRSFAGEGRLAKLDTLLRPGDYLFIEFGHNDQKERGPGVGAFLGYKQELERFVADARAHGAIPVLLTPVSRRTFGPDGKIRNSLGDFPEAVRRVAREQNAALIDLNAMSQALYEALGPEGAKGLFPVVKGALEGTHHNDFGAYEIARCVAEGIRRARLPLAGYLHPEVSPFDPLHPDAPASFAVPPSPRAADEKPYGD